MGRNLKEGLSYFPLDVDFFEDEKVAFISARFGVKGDGILARLLCRIYRQGYALKWDDDVALLFARSVGDINLHGLVKDVVEECLKREFFNAFIFKKFGLLTSKGIQKRYTKICTDAKRKNWEIPENIDLLNPKCAFTPEEIKEIPEKSTQRKEKESKVKESIEEGANAPPSKQEDLIKRQKEFGKQLAPFVSQYPKEMIRQFYDYWSEPNKSRTKMKYELESTWDIHKRLSRWRDNQDKFNKGKVEIKESNGTNINDKLKSTIQKAEGTNQ